MFEINTEVIYGMSGVCKIVDIRTENFSDEEKLYYVLNPLNDKDAIIYVPVHNEKSVSKMKNVLKKEEVLDLIRRMPQEELIEEADSKHRKELFSKIIKNGDRKELIRLIKTVYAGKKEREKAGKKMWVADEDAMKKAEKILYQEFAVVLQMQYDEILPFIKRELKGA